MAIKFGTLFVTSAGWCFIVVLYAYKYIWSGVAHPSALDRVPIDPEAVAIERMPEMQLIGFAVTRFPFLVAGLVGVLLIEIKALSRHRDRGDLNGSELSG